MKLTMLGTGNAVVTACYNTCFTLDEDGGYFLVDGGGGNTGGCDRQGSTGGRSAPFSSPISTSITSWASSG